MAVALTVLGWAVVAACLITGTWRVMRFFLGHRNQPTPHG